MTSGILLPLINGLSQAAVLFISAAGLTLVFGVLRIVNFSHGSFMMGAGYLAFALAGARDLGPGGLAVLVLTAGVAVGVLAAIVEVAVLRRVYAAPEFYMVLATYAVLLLMQGAVEHVWGLNPLSLRMPAALNVGVSVLGVLVPVYSLVTAAAGGVVAVGLWVFLTRTAIGKVIRAAASDRSMTEALGVNVPALYTIVFAVGVCLAAIAGGITAPTISLLPEIGVGFVIQAFSVVVVGGLGSVGGALLAAVLLGVLDSFLSVYVPVLGGITFFVAMAAILIVRPHGLLGRA